MIDVLVAGGGPAGLATAIQCSQAGLSVVVAEPRSFPVDKACGEGLMPGALPRLAALGIDVTGLAGHPIRGIRYLDARRSADAMFRRGNGLGLRRLELHAALSARVASLGIEVLPARVADFTQDEAGVTAAIRPAGVRTPGAGAGTSVGLGTGPGAGAGLGTGTGAGLGDLGRPITARYLVAADGLHSPIRRSLGLDPPPAQHIRYGLRRHYRLAPWTDLVEVYWSAGCEAYVTPVGDDVVGVAVLGESRAGLDSRLAAFPALLDRLRGAAPASDVRGAGPLRQNVRCRVAGRVLLAGDAAGYLDALTGEGIGAALAQAEVLAARLAADRPADYERSWRQVTRKGWVLTSGLLWSRHQRLLGPRIVPAAARLPWLFGTIVNQVAWA